MDGILRGNQKTGSRTTGLKSKSLRICLKSFLHRHKRPATLRSKLAKRATDAKKTQAVASSSLNAEHDNVHEDASSKTSTARTKLRSIPVKVLFNDPDLNLRANYTLFDRATARPLCVGDGQTCKRIDG